MEILDDGRGPGREPSPLSVLGDRLAGRWRGHRVLGTAAGALLSVVALAGVLVAVRATVPPLPGLVVTWGDQGQSLEEPWVPDPSGRPAGAVRLGARLTVGLADGPRAEGAVRVLGLAGPGIGHNDRPGVDVPASGEGVPVPVGARVDCAQVPENVPADAYGLRVQVSGAGHRVGVVPVGEVGGVWARAVQVGCATWTARRSLTVTAVAARVDPVKPQVKAAFTVTNTGTRPATLSRSATWEGAVRIEAGLPATVPTHGSATVDLTLALSGCDGPATSADPGAPVLLSHWFGMVAAAGPMPTGPGPSWARGEQEGEAFRAEAGGRAPTGIVLAPEAAADLTGALRAACGDVGQVVVLFQGARFEAARGEVVVSGLIDLPPGRVRSLTLVPDPGSRPAEGRGANGEPWPDFRLVGPPPGPLVPDRSGQVRFSLRFRAAGARCVPGFGLPGMTAVLRVPTPGTAGGGTGASGGTVREVPYGLFLDLASDAAARPWLCEGSG